MRNVAIGTVMLLGMVASAGAADVPVYTKAPPLYNWTGLYIGGNVGYGWDRSNTTETFTDPAIVLATVNPSFNLDGVIGGGQVGYNWQSGPWVLGIEGDLQATGQSGGTNDLCGTGVCAQTTIGPPPNCQGLACGKVIVTPGGPVTDALSQRLEWLDTLRGRIGWTVTPTFLAYVTGGLAVGVLNTSGLVTGTNGATSVVGSFNSNSVHAGGTVGVGLEAALAGRWTGKVEYLYVDLGTFSGGSFATPIVGPSGSLLNTSFSSRLTDNVLRAGVNYRF